MNVFLPMHLSPWQAFLHNTLAQWCLPFIIIGLLVLSLICFILPFILLTQEIKLDIGPDPFNCHEYQLRKLEKER